MRRARVAISSWVAMTLPHSWASTVSRKVSWSDRSSGPETTRKMAIAVRPARAASRERAASKARSNGCTLYDDDFSFLSGWGLGLYRASKNVVSHCIFDYCVRGYSHDVYWRGQDSAGILMFERCCDNLFVHDSATHGGDGVFLFAGNDTEGLRYGTIETREKYYLEWKEPSEVENKLDAAVLQLCEKERLLDG